MRPRVTLLLLAGFASGQTGPGEAPSDPRPWVQTLAGEGEAAARVAMRYLMSLPADRVPRQELVALLRHHDEEIVRRAVTVLASHGLAADRVDLDHPDPGVRLRSLPLAGADRLAASVRAPREESEVRCAALLELEKRGELAGEVLLGAFGADDEELSRTAEAILVYGRVPLPGSLSDAVADPLAAPLLQRLLPALARKPRPQTAELAAGVAFDAEWPLHDRLFALATLPPARQDRSLALLVLEGAATEDTVVQDATFYAAANLRPDLADGLVTEVDRRVRQGAPLERMLGALTRLSKEGETRLLGLCAALPRDSAETVAQWLSLRDSEAYLQRVRAAADGEIDWEPWLFLRAGRYMDTPKRIARMVEVLTGAPVQEARLRAFDVLLGAGVYRPEMLEFAVADAEARHDRARRLMQLDPESLSPDVMRELLRTGDPDLQNVALRAASRRPLSEEVEAAALEIVKRAEEAQPGGAFTEACRAITLAGSERAVRTVWDLLRGRGDLRARMVLWMCEDPKPWVQALLLTELADHRAGDDAPESAREELEFVELGLARLGDRHLLDRIVRRAPDRSPWFLRQCRPVVVRAMRSEHAEFLAGVIQDRERDAKVRSELARWLASRTDLGVEDALLAVWRSDDEPEIREEALRGILAGERREALVGELREALGGGSFDERSRDLAYEVLATMPDRLGDGDLELLARIALQAPLADPEAEAAMALRFPTGRAGFPLLSAVVDRLRRDPEADAGPAFERVASEVRPMAWALTRQRLLSLLLGASPAPGLLDEIGAPVAGLLLRVPDADGLGSGAAHLLLAERAESEGDLAAAERHYRQALFGLVFRQDARWTARTLLGERDALRREHPRAWLAARPYVCRARRALRDGDLATAQSALAAARELAAGDARSVREVDTLSDEVKR